MIDIKPLDVTGVVRTWVRDHAYADDDIVLGDAGLTESQLPSLHQLLDQLDPDWRSALPESEDCP